MWVFLNSISLILQNQSLNFFISQTVFNTSRKNLAILSVLKTRHKAFRRNIILKGDTTLYNSYKNKETA